jgi:hypothetical protein
VVWEDGGGDPASYPIAIGYANISEPTPVDIFNNTDYSCLNSTWYRYDDPAAMAIADSDSNGSADRSDIYPHILYNLSFLAGSADSGTLDSKTSTTLFAAGPVLTGQTLRMGYILTDHNMRYAYSDSRLKQNGDTWGHASFNNIYPGQGFSFPSAMQNFRNTKIWWGAGVIAINPEYNGTCDWNSLNQKLGL